MTTQKFTRGQCHINHKKLENKVKENSKNKKEESKETLDTSMLLKKKSDRKKI